MKAVKKQAFGEGDVFAVPLSDGTHAVGQVVKITKRALNSCVCAFFDMRLPHGTLSLKDIPLRVSELIAVQFVTVDLLKQGVWAIFDRREIPICIEDYIALQDLDQRDFVGAHIIGSANIQELLNAYYALRPWDNWHEPDYLDKLLVSHAKRPANVVLTRRGHKDER